MTSTGTPPADPRRRRGNRQQLVLVAPQGHRRAPQPVQAARLAAVAERPEQARRGDVGEVPGHRPFFRAEMGEALDERLGDALGEEVAHPLGGRHGEHVEARIAIVEAAERRQQGERRHGLGTEHGEVGGEHPAGGGADDGARERAGGVEGVPCEDEPAEVVVGWAEAGTPVEPGQFRDHDVPPGVLDDRHRRRARRVAGDARQVDEVPLAPSLTLRSPATSGPRHR